jgi:hypothetical protein
LAVETGGRFTRNTNDLSLAYVRAQRDLACRYAVGFYDTRPDEDVLHEVNIKVRRPGVRVIHPRRYRFGSDDVARESLRETVYTAPAPFESEAVSGAVIPIRPVSSKHWEAAVVMRFAATIPESGSNVVTFGAKLDDAAGRAVHAFDSSVRVESRGRTGEQQVMVVEPAHVAPGEYELSITVNDPEAGDPRSLVTTVELPKLSRKGLVVAPPVLVRPPSDGMAVSWVRGFSILSGETVEPLMGAEHIPAGPLTAITHICGLSGSKAEVGIEVERTLQRQTIALDRITAAKEEAGECRLIVDELPSANLEPGRYEFEVRVRGGRLQDEMVRQVCFTIAQ